MKSFLTFLVSLALACCCHAQSSSIAPQYLRCEWQVNPAGIDAVHPHFSWELSAVQADARGLRQTAYEIQAGEWDSGKVLSPEIFQVPYAGKALAPGTRYSWKVRVWDGNDQPSAWSQSAEFVTGQLRAENWKAHWIAASPDEPMKSQALENRGEVRKSMPPLPIFRREFEVTRKVRQALVFVSGLGHYELHINGMALTDRLLAPGWTNYRKRVFYNTYDVSDRVKKGKNALGVLLGSGMYDVPGIEGRYTKFIGSFGQPKLILELHLRYDDGSEVVIASDKSWTTAPGPITFSSTYGGEDYDARAEQAGWDKPGFKDSGWKDAVEVNGPGGALTAEVSPPIRVTHTYEPVKTTQPRPGVTVYDMGQNFSGWPEITVRGKAGSSVKLISGELLDADGLVSQHSADASPKREQSYSYTLKGGDETWHPRFSYWGFRYVQVESGAEIVSLSGKFLHDDVETAGQFHTSDTLFERIHQLIDMAVLSNMFSVLTDCPHREKLGWLEQTYLAGSSILLNHDGISLYQKMAQDIRDSQLPDGMVPGIAPEYVAFVDKNGVSTVFRDSPEWGSASILSPWAAYQFYGDRALLAEQYESMRAYAAYLKSKAKDHILDYGLGDWYDIGPGPPGESQLTSKAVTATATYYADLSVLGEIAAVLDKPEDARTYSEEATQVKNAFNRLLFHADTGQYDRGSQTANAMPLALGMVPAGQEEAVLNHLVEDIRRHENHVTAGDIGFHFVVRALTDHGRSDVLYDMLSRTDSPSYGYQLARGATALTEAWDTNPDSSQNHFMLGHGQEWFVRGLVGIRVEVDRPAAERIRIQPNPVGGIESASASYHSVLGEVRSEWKQQAGKFTLKVSVPVGSVATVEVPGRNPTESGKAFSTATPVGSGEYEFSSELN
ncbi:MAG TPA: family 78 glycoside hydrolase catalytic domain [Terriglobales bacterium]|nr:family 78 glycoside hydrolase catalytic domain [Terriglobales bacterium]